MKQRLAGAGVATSRRGDEQAWRRTGVAMAVFALSSNFFELGL